MGHCKLYRPFDYNPIMKNARFLAKREYGTMCVVQFDTKQYAQYCNINPSFMPLEIYH
jgi:hypothetical protein